MDTKAQHEIAEALSAFEGLQIQCFASEAEGHPAISKYTVDVYPIPTALVQDLNQTVINAVHQFFVAQGIVTTERTDLTSAGQTVQ